MVSSQKEYSMVIVGATGVVGKEMLRVLEERQFPLKELKLAASEKSAGKTVEFKGEHLVVQKLTPEIFKGSTIAFFTASSAVSKEFIPHAVQAGCVVVDDSSAYRADPEVPLVVPEVNGHLLKTMPKKPIFPVANCATIQLVVALAPIHRKSKIRRVVVSTYQSTSGAGKKAMEELSRQVTDLYSYKEPKVEVFPCRIAFNVIPQIDQFALSGYTGEEEKIAFETKKIFGDEKMGICATSVRVPTFHGHAESVNVETEEPITVEEARELFKNAQGVELADDGEEDRYPILEDAVGRDEVLVGRLRADPSHPNALNLWVVGDNLRKGAALNAVQILEKLRENGLI